MNNNKQLFGALLIAISFFLAWPFPYAEYQKVSVIKAAIAEREQTIKDRQEILVSIQDLKAQYDQLGPEVRRFANIIPAKKSSAEVLSAIDVIISQTGNLVTSVNFSSKPGLNNEPSTLRFTLEGSGNYAGVKALLAALEKNVPLTDVENMQLSPLENTSTIIFKINAVTYFVQSDATATE